MSQPPRALCGNNILGAPPQGFAARDKAFSERQPPCHVPITYFIAKYEGFPSSGGSDTFPRLNRFAEQRLLGFMTCSLLSCASRCRCTYRSNHSSPPSVCQDLGEHVWQWSEDIRHEKSISSAATWTETALETKQANDFVAGVVEFNGGAEVAGGVGVAGGAEVAGGM